MADPGEEEILRRRKFDLRASVETGLRRTCVPRSRLEFLRGILDCGPVRVVSFALLTIVLELSESTGRRLPVERKEDPLVPRLGALVVSQAEGALLL